MMRNMVTTVRHPAHHHVTIRRTGCTVSVEAFEKGTLVFHRCGSTAEAKKLEQDTIKSWRACAEVSS